MNNEKERLEREEKQEAREEVRLKEKGIVKCQLSTGASGK